MAVELGTLRAEIEIDDSDLNKTQRKVDQGTKKMARSFKMLGGVIASAFAIDVARRALVMADNFQLLDVRIKNVTKSQKDYIKAQKELLNISNRTGNALADSVKLFESLTIASESLGATNDHVLQLTETMQQLGVIGGSSAEQMSNAMLQFGQAMAGGVVRAEEFNSIIENTPMIAQAIAKGLNKDVGELRKMVIAGELLSDDVMNAILKQSDEINTKFQTMPVTMERAWTSLTNNLGTALANFDDAAGFTESIAKWIQDAADALQDFNEESKKTAQIAERELKIRELMGQKTGVRKGERRKALTQEQKDAREVNKLLERNVEIEKQLARLTTEKIRYQSKSQQGREKERENRAKLVEDLNRELDLNARNIKLLEGYSEAAKQVVQLKTEAANIDATGTPTGETAKPVEPLAPIKKTTFDDFTLDAGIGAGDDSEFNAMLAKLGDETAAIKDAYLQRAQEIQDIENITAEERRKLIIENEKETNRQLDELNLERLENEKMAQIASLGAMQTFTDSFLQILQQGGKEQTALYKALFLANKAAAVAEIIINTELAAAKATGQLGVFGIPVSTAMRAAGYASAGLVAGMAFKDTFGGGRAQGGGVSPGLMHPVNENGEPELLVQGSRQYLLTGKSGGRVVGARDMLQNGNNSGGTPNIVVQNNGAPIQVDNVSMTRDEVRLMISDANNKTVETINNSLATGRGSTAQSLKKGFKSERNLNR